MSVGVITHLRNASIAETVRLARAAEEAGADWVGVPDAFWWRDTWVLLSEVARATSRIAIGPLVTNPYLRHPFHTAAAIATIQEIAGPRVFVGIGAGGSEVSGAAGIPRTDSPQRIVDLARLLRRVADGGPLDPGSGRTLEVPLALPPVLVGGRGAGVLGAAGRVGDQALLWAIPSSELRWSIAQIDAGAARGRESAGDRPELVWAPLVDHDDASREQVRLIAAYSVLNSRREVREGWGLDEEATARIRKSLVAGGAANAADLIPAQIIDDLITSSEPAALGAKARELGIGGIALPAFDIETVGDRIEWAASVLATVAPAAAILGTR
jgi:5,10-methylenetetrahydromethanopterin reductase